MCHIAWRNLVTRLVYLLSFVVVLNILIKLQNYVFEFIRRKKMFKKRDLFDFSTLQSKTPFLSLYKLVFIAPVTTLGRTLLLTIDFLFIERFTVALFRRSVFLLVRTSLFLHRNMHFFGWVFLLLALILSAALFFLQKGDF